MNDFYLKHIDNLNNPNRDSRLESLKMLMKGISNNDINRPFSLGKDVNNHIHTTYSFSPYSPSKSVWMAYMSGLITAGIMDHDSVAGAEEFIRAGEILGFSTTAGLEIRVDMSNTLLKGRKINNPDQNSVIYMAIHGIPHTKLSNVQSYIRPYAEKRNERNEKMVNKLNGEISNYGISIDFEKDVMPLSLWNEGGSITERHISMALSKKMIELMGKGERLVDFYKNTMKIPLKQKIEALLLDTGNPVYEYDLLGAIKSDMIEMFYIDATDECPDVFEAVEFSNSVGAISAYAYLGDVNDSVTGDKKPQKFEDEFIEELFGVLVDIGFKAVAYMPSRNTKDQLMKVKKLCTRHSLMEISGEDINSPRQKFVCDAMRDEMFENLVDSTWALISHEQKATKDLSLGLFSDSTIMKYPELERRIKIYSGEVRK